MTNPSEANNPKPLFQLFSNNNSIGTKAETTNSTSAHYQPYESIQKKGSTTENPFLKLFSSPIALPTKANATPKLKTPGLMLSTQKDALSNDKTSDPKPKALGKRKSFEEYTMPGKKRRIGEEIKKKVNSNSAVEVETQPRINKGNNRLNATQIPRSTLESREFDKEEESIEELEKGECKTKVESVDQDLDESKEFKEETENNQQGPAAPSFLNTPNAPTVKDPSPEIVSKICPHFNSLQGCKHTNCNKEHTVILSKKKEGLIRNLSTMLMKHERHALTEPKSFWDVKQSKQKTRSNFPKFQDCSFLHAKTKKALKVLFKYSHMTRVQSETIVPKYIEDYLERDYMVKAKTGSGKTLAFLIPVVEILLHVKSELEGSVYELVDQMKQITCVILSPTRELAIQTEKEAQKLLAFHTNLTCKAIIGGTKNMQSERSNFENHLVPDILITTPGRFYDHLLNTNGFVKHLKMLQVLVMDEADQLLDQGFKDALLEILQFLPSRIRRQTLMFSATISQAVKSIARQALKPKFDFINCVDENDVDTNDTLLQQYMPVTFANKLPILYSLLEYHIANTKNYKIIVFFPTANQAEYFSHLFNHLQITNYAMHSKKEQSYRRRISDLFRNESNLIMFSSDVSARGVDYASVSLIIQVNLPSSMEQYVHRIGRTARAGKSGVGIILLCPFEAFFWKELKAKYGREIVELTTLELPLARKKALDLKIEKSQFAVNQKGDELASKSYVSFLGYYRQFMKRLQWSNETLVQMGNDYASICLGLNSPRIPLRTAVNLKLEAVRGLVIKESSTEENQSTSKGKK